MSNYGTVAVSFIGRGNGTCGLLQLIDRYAQSGGLFQQLCIALSWEPRVLVVDNMLARFGVRPGFFCSFIALFFGELTALGIPMQV